MNTTATATHAAISQTAFGYDAAGVQTATSAAGAFAYTYDADGRVLTEASPGGLTLTYTYDAAGNVASLADSAGGLTASTHGTSLTRREKALQVFATELKFFGGRAANSG